MEENSESPSETREISSQSLLKLKELLFEEEITEQMKNEILKILSEVAEEYMNGPEYVKDNSTDAYLLKKWPQLFSDHSDAMEELAENYPWLLPFRFILMSNYVISDDDLLKLINLQKDLEPLYPSKKIIEKLINDQGIRSLLVEKRREESEKNEPLSEYLLKFCQSYPTLESLRSLSGCVLSEKMQQSSLNYEEKLLIKELWCSCNPIRKKILELSLPLNLADSLEKENVTDLKQLLQSKIMDLTQHFTALEKDKFNKWYRNSVSNTAKRLSKEGYHRNKLQSKVKGTISLIDKCLHSSRDSSASDKENLNQQLKALHFGCWDGRQEEIGDIKKALKKVEKTLGKVVPYKTDKDLVAKVSGGFALHGLLFGIDSNNVLRPATHPLLKAPDVCDIKEPSISPITRCFFFPNQLEATKMKRNILATGFSFYFPAHIDYTDQIHSGLMTVLEFNIYPMASYSIEQSQMKILPSVIKSLQDVSDMTSAEEFLKKYGSHVSLGVNHLGGIMCASIQVCTSGQLTQDRLETDVEEKMKAAHFSVFKADQSSVEFDTRGPNIPVPKLFEELLKTNSSSWHIIDRGDIPAALLPIWTLIEEKHNNLKDQADLLRRAWLRKAAKLLNVDVVNQEWIKVDNLLTSGPIDDEKFRHYSGNRPITVAAIENLADILSKELRHFEEGLTQSQTNALEQQQLQTRFEIILYELLRHREYRSLELRNAIEDLLLTTDYEWKENKFGFHISVNSFRKLIEEIRRLQEGQENRKKSEEQQQQTNETNENLNKKEQHNRISTADHQHHTEEKLLDYNRVSNNLVTREKKPYAAFLIDRPFSTNNPTRENNDSNQDSIIHLVNCLRYRLLLSTGKTAVPNSTITKVANVAHNEDSNIPAWKASFRQSSKTARVSALPTDQKENTRSLYDTLLQLIDEYDAAGAAEIFRLLLERRSAIPLFIPESKKHHLLLLKRVILQGGIRMGEDKSLMRVAVVSCRKRNQSQTCEILKNLFHIDSVHRHDYQNKCITKESLLAEIGCGCVLMQGKNVQRVLVTHVVGDFRPLWPFLREFADYLLIEDVTYDTTYVGRLFEKKENEQILKDVNTADSKRGEIPYVCVWKPSVEDTYSEMKETDDECKFRHINIQGQLGERTFHILRSIVEGMVQENATQLSSSERLSLYEMPFLREAHYDALEFSAMAEKSLSILTGIQKLGLVKINEFVLQKNYKEQAKHEEAKWEHRLEEKKVREENAKIQLCMEKRRNKAPSVQGHALLELLLNLLANPNPCSRVLSIRLLEKELAERSERELEPELIEIRQLYSSFVDQSAEARKGDAREKEKMEVARKELNDARTDLNEKVLSIEHLWRELSHLYTTLAPEQRTAAISKVPRLAAQHLLDGFCIEILDGDSNLLHLDWVKEVLHQLGQLIGKQNRERIFVLSVMGVQSSGKSTLLNTMFGIQMRTSVGQCTRGVNMQLLKVQGRPEYDYILLLDTEGTRSPEYHGLSGSEKRDNQMATLSILLADATIIVIPGENDAAVKEILPIVLMAYQGSKLAEINGGRRSSMLFFVYNRIDTTQKEKLGTIVQTLGTSLNEAFNHVQNLTGKFNQQLASESLFKSFKLGAANSSDSDVCILGNVKKEFEPPGDVPNSAYGEALVEFREHIHRRVTSTTGGIAWKDRSIIEFSKYMEDVWKCICSANFTFNFASVVERMAFDSLDTEYKKIEQELAEAYRKCFESLSKEMVQEKGKTINPSTPAVGQEDVATDESRLLLFESKLRDEISPVERELDVKLEEIVIGNGREKWSLQFKEQWRACKKEQERNWNFSLKTSFVTLFKYENHVESYKKKLRKEIKENFRKNSNVILSMKEKEELFKQIYTTILDEVKLNFPSKDVSDEVSKVYEKSNVIRLRSIEMDNKNDYDFCEDINNVVKSAATKGDSQVVPHSFERYRYLIKKIPGKIFRKVADGLSSGSKQNKEPELIKEPSQHVWDCFMLVYKLVNNIVIGKLCYDDSIVSNVITDTDDIIRSNKVTVNSEVKIVHVYGRTLITELMQEIQSDWEANNSVYVKLEQDRDAMYQYFLMVSQGLEKTQLFARHMANVLKNVVAEAFEKDMLQQTSNGIRNKQWLHDARFIHKHMDLYLIDLLEDNKIDEVLEHLRKPKKFYNTVLQCMIVQNTPDVKILWQRFIKQLKRAIKEATSTTVPKSRAQKFVSDLRDEILKNDGLHSQFLAKAFLIDCSGEYEDCDNEGEKEFQDACTTELFKVLDNHKSPEGQKEFAKKLSPKVVEYMKTLNDSAALPRCDACCPMCESLCIKAANHDTTHKQHDTIHQPGGIGGVQHESTKELVATTCSQAFEKNRNFFFGDSTVLYKYREFDKKFPEWMNPKINEELPLREYILAKYNDEIAKMYDGKPCKEIPSQYANRNLAIIREQLERDTAER